MSYEFELIGFRSNLFDCVRRLRLPRKINVKIYEPFFFSSQLDGRMLAGQMRQVSGGVGRNIADALGRFGHDVHFLSAVGDDSNGQLIMRSLGHIVSNCTRIFFFFFYQW